MKVTTALIFAAGFGTRMLPVTAAIQKDMLPILDRPTIDYVVSDCIAAGVTRIIFVTRPGSHILQDYYLGNPKLEEHLQHYHKTTALALLEEARHPGITYDFVEQPAGKYGTAATALAATHLLPQDEAFIVCGGDDFIWHADGRSEMSDLVDTFSRSGAIAALTTLERPEEELSRYGVLKIAKKNGEEYLEDFVEKPAPGTAPSNLINISKYIFTPQIMDYTSDVQPDPISGEYYITDAVLAAAKDKPVVVHRATGTFLDSGNPQSWLEANMLIGGLKH